MSEWRTWLDQPALARLWDRLRDRLERNGLQVRGRLRLDDVSGAERAELSLLMERVYPDGAVSISLGELDSKLRSGAAGRGLVDVVAELRGPLVDRPAARNARRLSVQSIWTAADDALRDHGFDDATWSRPWLEDVRRSGALTRLDPVAAIRLIGQAIQVVAVLRSSEGVSGRGELSERVTGTAHGLDDDTLLSRLVLRALARMFDADPPHDARSRRELWEAAGVSTDRVSTTVLTCALTPLGEDWSARQIRERSQHGAETHLTFRDLRRMAWRLPPDTEVFVCENPRVVEAAADHGCTRPLVCVSGNPTTTALSLLDALCAAGARLAYRGDFDWPGIGIANRMIGRYGARPWRMSTADYEAHVAEARDRGTPLQPLAGSPAEAVWDPELTAAMIGLNVAVQEESALALLLIDLS